MAQVGGFSRGQHNKVMMASYAAMDRCAIEQFLDPDNGLSDNRAAQAILKRMALVYWEPLAKFYRQNYHVNGTVGDPEP